jgi:hypothetical protein
LAQTTPFAESGRHNVVLWYGVPPARDQMNPVAIAFDCLPLRSIGRVDVPIDASPDYRARGERLQQAIEKHGRENAYFLYNTYCVYRLANSDIDNMLRFTFDGVLITDRSDAKAASADLAIELQSETCGPMSPAVLEWFRRVVTRAVLIEFDRFIASGRLEALAGAAEANDYVGMNV